MSRVPEELPTMSIKAKIALRQKQGMTWCVCVCECLRVCMCESVCVCACV
jgi:hypothetical protein